ncbi:MAG: heme-binding protein [Oceanococcaceae bacterium]
MLVAGVTAAVLISTGCEGDRRSFLGTGVGIGPCAGDCNQAFLDQANVDAVRLLASEVEQILAQAAAEAQAQGAPATVAVVDRVGNVLGIYQMDDAPELMLVSTSAPNGVVRTAPDRALDLDAGEVNALTAQGRQVRTGLEELQVPSTLGAVAKAISGAYLSSEGNAFGTRTANQIVQEHFNPGEFEQPGGPLFGVQFSQLACSDLARRESDGAHGPKRSPLGLSADPGGLPLYKNGVVVGGIGVIADGIYGIDPVVTDTDRDLDEIIAIAGTAFFAAPRDRRGDRITVEGKNFRFTDVDFEATRTAGNGPASLAGLPGRLVSLRRYTDQIGPNIRPGVAFGTPASGFVPSTDPAFDGLNAFELVEPAPAGLPATQRRFPPRAGTDAPRASDGVTTAAPLSATEVEAILRNAVRVARQGRAQIRRPVGAQIHVTVSVVDTEGAVLGILRTHDGPVFGTDVSLQKARTAAFFSRPDAAQQLAAAGQVTYLDSRPQEPVITDLFQARDVNGDGVANADDSVAFDRYLAAVQSLFGNDALTGQVAFADRSGGNLSRPFFPDGVRGNPPGPLSKPFAQWSPFSTGLQLDLVYENIAQHVASTLPDISGVPDVRVGCGGPPNPAVAAVLPFATTVPRVLNNGLQIFPGSVPIYRNVNGTPVLVGAIGVSGDGVDQDDMVAFLGVNNASRELGGSIINAPVAIRADNLVANNVRLRYVQCPQAPQAPNPPADIASALFPVFPSSDDRVCEGL